MGKKRRTMTYHVRDILFRKRGRRTNVPEKWSNSREGDDK